MDDQVSGRHFLYQFCSRVAQKPATPLPQSQSLIRFWLPEYATTNVSQKNMLMDSDVVMSYLTAMNTEVESELPERYEASDGEEDFS